MKLILVKKYYAWLISNMSFLVAVLFLAGFYAFHDKVFNSNSVVEMNYLLATILSHAAIVFYGGKFILFLFKPKELVLSLLEGKVQFGTGQSLSVDKAVFRVNRFDAGLAAISFYHNSNCVLKIDPGFKCTDGLDALVEQLQAIGCEVEKTQLKI